MTDESSIQAANLGGSGSSPGILALVAFVAFIFGCATFLMVQKVRKRKGNAGKILKSLLMFYPKIKNNKKFTILT